MVNLEWRDKMSPVKEEAIKIITNLPEDASWEDIMYEFYAKDKIQKGLDDIKSNRVFSHDEIKKRLGI